MILRDFSLLGIRETLFFYFRVVELKYGPMSVFASGSFQGEIRTVILICGELANSPEWKSTCQKYREFYGMGFKMSKVQILSSRAANESKKRAGQGKVPDWLFLQEKLISSPGLRRGGHRLPAGRMGNAPVFLLQITYFCSSFLYNKILFYMDNYTAPSILPERCRPCRTYSSILPEK